MTSVRDIITISGLAVRVHIAYKNAPDGYKHISKDVAALQILIDKAAKHFKGTIISSNGRLDGQRVLKGCQSMLQDLYSLIEKYNKLVLINKRLVLKAVKLGKEDITTLHIRLISETVLLKGVVRSYEYIEVQAQLTAILGPGAKSRVSVTSIASFAANTNTKTNADTAYRWFYKDLAGAGVTKDVKRQKGGEILDILRSQGMVASSEIGGSKSGGQDQVLETAYKQFREDLYQMGITEALMPPKDEILKILRSRGISSSQSGGSSDISGDSIGDQDHDSSTKDIPSFRLSPQLTLFPTEHEAFSSSLMPEALDNSPLLHLAADNSHSGTMKLLFGKDALLDQDNNTFLHCAAAHGYANTVKLLLDKGAPIEAVNTDHLSPLHLAAGCGHTGVVELLLGEGASLEAIGKYNRTPLHTAAQRGQTPTVELLLKKGASFGALDEDNETPLHLAAADGHIDTVELLLGKGAPSNSLGLYKNTPLHRAAQYGHTAVVELLLSNGALIEAKGQFGRTPLHIAAEKGQTPIVELLLKKGASFGPQDEDTETPLDLAAAEGHIDIVELLLGKGALINSMGMVFKSTPLHWAARHGHTALAELLLGKGALIEAKGGYGRTPLHIAAEKGHTRTVELLLNKGASFGALDQYNETPLHLAAGEGHIDIVELLLNKGALIEAESHYGTPRHLATHFGHTDTVQLLENKAAELADSLQTGTLQAGNLGFSETGVHGSRARPSLLTRIFSSRRRR